MKFTPCTSWTPAHSGHLLSRAGFGGTPAEIYALHALGLDAAVDWLINRPEDTDRVVPPPAWTADPQAVPLTLNQRDGKPQSEEQKRVRNDEARKIERERLHELRSHWIERMILTQNPLREKLTLFWHDHFATSVVKVQDAQLMWRQNETLRTRALGHFPDLVKAISRDPAMIKWLDLTRSDRKAPNENFARELLELFTLGEGHYSEDDIREAARAFTGYRFVPPKREFRIISKSHDGGEKTFLGKTGSFSGDDIIAIAVSDPACPEFLARKLWTFFVSENPSPAQIEMLAATLRSHDLEIAPTLGDLFRSADFYAPPVWRSQIKSPVQWLVHTCRSLEILPPPEPALSDGLARLGQLPFAPPNVGGWEWGRAWINSTSLILRYNLAGFLSGRKDRALNKTLKTKHRTPPDLDALFPADLRAQPERLAAAITLRLFGTSTLPSINSQAMAAVNAARQPVSNSALHEILHELMATPDYQLC